MSEHPNANDAHATGAVRYTGRPGQTALPVYTPGLGPNTWTTVNVSDAERLHKHSWRLHPDGYAVTDKKRNGRRRRIYLHRAVLHAPDGTVVDHISGERLDNRRENLRLATPSENNANSRSRRPRSGYRGVYWHKQADRWVAQISVDGSIRHLGLFECAVDAAKAYDAAAREAWGPFARSNFGPQDSAEDRQRRPSS